MPRETEVKTVIKKRPLKKKKKYVTGYTSPKLHFNLFCEKHHETFDRIVQWPCFTKFLT